MTLSLSFIKTLIKVPFDSNLAIAVFNRRNPPIEGDTITVGNMVAEFKQEYQPIKIIKTKIKFSKEYDMIPFNRLYLYTKDGSPMTSDAPYFMQEDFTTTGLTIKHQPIDFKKYSMILEVFDGDGSFERYIDFKLSAQIGYFKGGF